MYGKMFRQMYHGTLATTGPWQALVTFQQLIVLADQDGVVDMTAEAISRETTVPLEIIQTGIEALEQPDPDSRTPDEAGRRILRLAENRRWGWRITNYRRYRDMKREEDRRAYHRQYWHARKAKNSTDSTDSTGSTQTQQTQPIAEADAYTELESGAKSRRPARKCPKDWEPGPELRAAMGAECPGVDLSRETLKFRDHTFASPRSDWNATWRNWVRKAAEMQPKQTGRPTNTPDNDEWPQLKARAVQRGFREPLPNESAGAYQTLLSRFELANR